MRSKPHALQGQIREKYAAADERSDEDIEADAERYPSDTKDLWYTTEDGSIG